MLTFECDFSPAIQRFDTVADQARDAQKLLKRFAGYLNWTAKEAFTNQPGWEPLAASTQAKLQSTRTSAITVQGQVRSSYVKQAAPQLARALKTGGLAARENMAEFLRLGRSGNALDSVLSGGAGTGSRAVERLRRMLLKAAAQKAAGKRVSVGGNKRKSDRHQLLGKLRKSIERRVDVGQGEAIAESRVPWSGVHNKGGAAGHGAKIPARVFLTIDERGAVALAEIALEHLMEN